jgi:hypothetical protein
MHNAHGVDHIIVLIHKGTEIIQGMACSRHTLQQGKSIFLRSLGRRYDTESGYQADYA